MALRGTRAANAYIKITADGDGINAEIVSEVEKAGPGVEKAGKDHGERYGDEFSDGFAKRMKGRFSQALKDELKVSRNNDRDFGDMVGRMFGGGSRNNFLNVFGRSIGNITNLTEGLFKTLAKGGQVFSLFGAGMRKAGEDASFMQKAMGGFSEVGAGAAGGLGKAFGSLAASGPGAVVAIVAVTAALSIMASVVGALIGLVTALAATITAALTASLAVLGGAILAVVAAGGLLTLAFTSMTNAQSAALNSAFRPLKAEMTGLGQIMLTEMVPAFKTWSANLQSALMLAEPAAQAMGRAFAIAGNNLTMAASGPGFQLFATAMGTYLPAIVDRLSNALGGFLNGTLGMFAALMPQVTAFSGYLAQLGERFSAWATSAQGQNAISTFVDRALVSLQSLWNAVSAFGGFLVELLFSPEAMNAGNTIFDGLANTFRSFTRTVQRAAADGSLQKWFNDAIRFGSALWSVISALGSVFIALYNSGVINGVAQGLSLLAWNMKTLAVLLTPLINGFGSALVGSMTALLHPLATVTAAITAVGEAFKWVLNMAHVSALGVADFSKVANAFTRSLPSNGQQVLNSGTFSSGDDHRNGAGSTPTFKMPKLPKFSMPKVQSIGTNALNNTYKSNGGYMPDPTKGTKKAWQNPFSGVNRAQVRADIKKSIIALNKEVVAGINAAAREKGGAKAVQDSFNNMYKSLHATGDQAVSSARSAVSSAQNQKQLNKAQKDLQYALNKQATLNNLARALMGQRIVKSANVVSLVKGLRTHNVTLAEFAAARAQIATKIEAANQKLTDAIALRNDYAKTVADSAKAFASIASAQAQTIDGVEQALTSNDIITNLQTKLAQIQKFQSDLQLLVGQGLSNDAYKQIVDQGVEGGQGIADALLAGGTAAIQQTNTLVSQINAASTALGGETAARMYQAGVNAAKGLVDGLTSQAKQLDAAAVRLGNSIAAAVKRSLGIHSPSTVLRDMMDYVGDGAVIGLDNQHGKVGTAVSALADLIAVNPGGPPANGGPPVSGNQNGQVFRDLIVNTPTEDPAAVAKETVNEMVGRL